MYTDRADAARKLVHELEDFKGRTDTVVAGIPPGGAIVAAELAIGLRLPFACLGVYTVPMATRPDAVLGVIDEDGTVTLDTVTEVTRYEVLKAGESALETLRADLEQCREGFEDPGFEGKTVIVSDEAIMSALPMQAAVGLLRTRGASRLVLATPVMAMDVRDEVTALFDYVYVLHTARHGRAAPDYYSKVGEPTLEELMISVRGAYAASGG